MADQVQDTSIVSTEPISAYVTLPRDLAEGPSADVYKKVAQPAASTISDPESVSPSDSINTNKLDTPVVMSVKSQTVNFGPDGKAIIDVVLQVMDVPNAVEYDVRITNSAGNV